MKGKLFGGAYLASGVFERDELSVGRTVADRRRSLGAALVSRLRRHLSLDDRSHCRCLRSYDITAYHTRRRTALDR